MFFKEDRERINRLEERIWQQEAELQRLRSWMGRIEVYSKESKNKKEVRELLVKCVKILEK